MVLQNDFKRQWELVQGSAVEAIRRVGASGRYILGPEVAAFEAALADGIRTRDLGGTAGTEDFTEAVLTYCRSFDPTISTEGPHA